MKKWMCLWLWMPVLAMAQPNSNANIDTILHRLQTIYMNGETHLPVKDSVVQLLATLQPDGSWAKFDYKENLKVSLPAVEHLSRLIKMAVAYQNPLHNLYHNSALAILIHKGLAFWIAAKPESQNWWYNQIGVPTELAKILVLMNNELTAAEKEAGIGILKRANKNGVLMAGNSPATGQNKIWVAILQMQAACLEGSNEYLKFSVKNAASEMKVTTGEGIQPDWSFHQHGPQLYSGGYGLNFVLDCAQLLYVLHGTAWGLSDTIVATISHFILDGQQYMIRGNKIDWGTMGREISRKDKKADKLMIACWYMAQLGTARRQEFLTLATGMQQDAANISTGISGNCYFYHSDFMVQQQPAYYASVKMASNRIFGSESGNDEGLKNYHLGDGLCLLLKTGHEYDNIFPLWDWQKLPGVTCRLRDSALPLIDWGIAARGSNAAAAGLSDGRYGMAAFTLEKDSVKAKKAWFFFDKEYVCLGAGISGTLNSPVVTGVEQCLANGTITYSEDLIKQTLLQDSADGKFNWVYHAGTAYILEGNPNVHLHQEQRTANWNVINRNTNEAQSGTVFSVWMQHDIQLLNATYEYVVVPQINLLQLPAYLHNKPYKILCNTSELQAVEHSTLGLLQAVFRKPGKLTSAMLEIEVDKPCLMLVQMQKKRITIQVADPENKPGVVRVGITDKHTGKLVTMQGKMVSKPSRNGIRAYPKNKELQKMSKLEVTKLRNTHACNSIRR